MLVREKSSREPESKFLLRAFVVWLVFITVESVLGTLRVLFLEPRMGAEPAQWTGFVIGSAALLIVSYLLIEWIRIPRWAALLEIGMLWVALTFSFEMAIGYMRGRSWQSLLAGYDNRAWRADGNSTGAAVICSADCRIAKKLPGPVPPGLKRPRRPSFLEEPL
jgi:hypothetical protein